MRKALVRKGFLGCLSILGGAGLLFTGCGAPADSQLNVVGGEIVPLAETVNGEVSSEFTAGSYLGMVQSGIGGARCSGTFIDIPGADKEAVYLLTATHCVDLVSMTARVTHNFNEKQTLDLGFAESQKRISSVEIADPEKQAIEEASKPLKIAMNTPKQAVMEGVVVADIRFYDYQRREGEILQGNYDRYQKYLEAIEAFKKSSIQLFGFGLTLMQPPSEPDFEENEVSIGDIALVRLLVKRSDLPTTIKFMQLAGEDDFLKPDQEVLAAGFGMHMDLPPKKASMSQEEYDMVKVGYEAEMQWLLDAKNKLAEMREDENTDPNGYRSLFRETNARLKRARAISTGSTVPALRQVALKFDSYNTQGKFISLGSDDENELKSICYGDSGGANFILKKGNPVLVGVTSRLARGGLSCAEASWSTDVKEYAQWVMGGPVQKLDEKYKEVMARLDRAGQTRFKVEVRKTR